MRTAIILSAIALLLLPLASQAQMTVNHSDGRKLMEIKPADTSNGFTLSLSGIEIGFEGRHGEPVVTTPASKRSKKAISRRRYKSSLTVLEFGFSEFRSPDYSMYPAEEHGFLDLHGGKSIHLAWNLFNGAAPLNRSRSLGISTALGIVWNNYAFSEDITIVRRGGMIHPEPISPDYKKSKLGTFAFTVPVVLEFNVKKVSISGGIYGNIVIHDYTKYKKPKEKNKTEKYYVNAFQGGFTMRAGFKNLCFFANYAMTDFFKSDKGPKTQPFTVGIGIF